MKLTFKLLLASLFLVTKGAFAQTYFYSAGTSTNAFPLKTTTSNRTQFLFTPADFGNPPAGNITKLYFMSATAQNSVGSFTNLTVRIGPTSLTALTTGPFVTGLTTVYTAPTTPIPVLAAGDWFEIVLQTPVFYSGTSNLIIDLSQTAYTGGISTRQNTSTGNPGGRIYGSVTGTTGTAGTATANIGFDYGGLPCVMAPITPTNGATLCAPPAGTTSTTLRWPTVTGATGYDVFLNTGTAATMLASSNQVDTFFTTPLAVGSYAWKIVPRDTGAGPTTCTNFMFTIAPNVTPAVTITASPSGPICSGTPVTYTAAITNGGTAPTYQWKKRSNNVGTNMNTYTDINLITNDTISVVVTSNAVCASPTSVTSNKIIPTILPTPLAGVSPSGNIDFCAGSSVLLLTAANTNLTYQWQLNGANISGATSASYNVSAPGTYRLIVSNGTCNDTSLNKVATVLTPPTSTISSVGTTFCQGATLTLTGPAPAAGIFYQWLLNGNPIAGATGSNYAASAAGSYSLALSNGSCADTSAVITITTIPPPVATATAASATNFCTGGSVVLNANTGSGLTYQWFLNNVAIPGATSATYTATMAGSYSFSVTNSTNCSNTSNAIVVAVSTLAPTTISALGATTFCLGDSVTLQTTTGAGLMYQWLLNNTPIAGATGVTVKAVSAGNYTVEASNGICTTTSNALPVNVNQGPPAIITPAGAASVCLGSGVDLNANVDASYTYQWRFNGNPINGAVNTLFTAYLPGNYSVRVSNGACPGISSDVVVTANPLPTPTVTINSDGTLSTDNFASYQWNLGGVPIPGATSQSYGPTSLGSYSVTVTDTLGCIGTSPAQTITTVGVGQVAAGDVATLYPNPVQNLLHVKAPVAVSINVTSIDGKQLLTANNVQSVDLGQLAPGLYIVYVRNAATGALLLVDKVNKR